MYGNFIAEGEKIAGELLKQDFIKIEKIFAVKSWLENLEPVSAKQNPEMQEISEQELKKISLLTTPNKVLLICKTPAPLLPDLPVRNELTLYLDGIQDPGNAGTILRIADWFGIRSVFFSPDSVESFHPKVVQASMGAFLRVNILETDLEMLFKNFPDLPVLGADISGNDIFKIEKPAEAIIVVGNEGKGISEKNRSLIKKFVSIPASGGGAESLNVAVAAGIICAVFRNKNR